MIFPIQVWLWLLSVPWQQKWIIKYTLREMCAAWSQMSLHLPLLFTTIASVPEGKHFITSTKKWWQKRVFRQAQGTSERFYMICILLGEGNTVNTPAKEYAPMLQQFIQQNELLSQNRIA